jgi:hypothetical protein
MPHIPPSSAAALGHAQIWRRAGKWSQSAVRLALVELDREGIVRSRIAIARNGVQMRLYWLTGGGGGRPRRPRLGR